MRFIKKHDLLFVFGGIITLSLTMMIFNDTREIGNNLLTEMTGVAVTVFVINKILERKESQKRITIDQRIFREIQSIIASYFSIWKHLVWRYFPEDKINDENDFLNIYRGLIQKTNITEKFETASNHRPESWKLFFNNRTIKECFQIYSNAVTEQINKFIDDYKLYMDPELLDCLLNIVECEYFKNIYMMGQEGTENVLIEMGEDINKLDCYIREDDQDHIKRFFALMDYSKKLKYKINRFSTEEMELYQIKKYFVHPGQVFINVNV